MIIATAGHVDHGKTRLVEALTGVDTDRTAEEKRRGLTIDLGFAYLDRPDGGSPLGFVDVPGHERFLKNMLAGVASIDLAMLVVAADQGPELQTWEHLSILQLLEIPRLVVVLTRTDLADPDRLRDARTGVAEMLATTPWATSPVFPVSALSGDGISTLRSHLLAIHPPPLAEAGAFRLAVDRGFSLTGAGQIATGAVAAGRGRVAPPDCWRREGSPAAPARGQPRPRQPPQP
ncbi:MAG: 50S ribosome-binding GTPase, partial [Ectothiorhodospiraceae bacterium]|nr:50S ribosome-binding GTPase [Ectothiorhodospiraceae bacterium]